MPDNGNERAANLLRVICETVVFRFSSEQDIMLVGEAEIVLVLTGSHAEPGVNLHTVRVDILTVYDVEGQDVYARIMLDAQMKADIERAALEHYLSPPKVRVELPGRVEW